MHLYTYDYISQEEAGHSGIDWNAPIPNEDENVNVPEAYCPLNNVDSVILQSTIPPISDTDDFGIDAFLQTLAFVAQKIA